MRGIIRTLFVLVVLALIAYVWLGWRPAFGTVGPIGTSTTGTIDTQKARERGAELGEKTAEAAVKVKEGVTEAALTTKIKAKMALDDSLQARAIDVSTTGGTVTVSGTVASRAQHDRAIALTRETEGVTRVVDRLAIH